MPQSTAANPLLHFEFRIPFDQIKAEQIEPAIAELLSDARSRLDALIGNPAPRTFENTMLALDQLTERLEYAMGIGISKVSSPRQNCGRPTTPSSLRLASFIPASHSTRSFGT
jgi:Zn-dependent oligopeptidase